ncbi:MAG: DegT/DnrJ/EryC1/StrS family aminotransferase [Alteromonadaceae bacterium]|nr:DegT/DnrJ/EryC1/StrS family aminotransferase [Alteromonadaceae bacterium]
MIALNRPFVPPVEEFNDFVKSANEIAWLSNFGPLETRLTEELKAYLGVEHLLLVNNGSTALQIAYRTFNIKHALTTPFSFIATASTLDWLNIDFSFADINPFDFNIHPDNVLQGITDNPNVDSVVATHIYGNPCDVRALETLCQEHNKTLIFDAAHAFSIEFDGESILNFGDASILSFHATKIFNSIEGGAIVFRNKRDYDIAREMTCFGMDKTAVINRTGINAKMNEYQAAAGLVCLQHFEEILQHRRQLFATYQALLSDIASFPHWHPNASTSGAYMPLILANEQQLLAVGEAFDAHGIGYRRYFHPELSSYYPDKKTYPSSLDVVKDIAPRVMCIPLHAYLTLEEVEEVCSVIRDVVS